MVLTSAITCLNLILPVDCVALDKGGCLICHQYASLVKRTESGQLKVLHIDEQIQLESDHGEVDCRQCHNQIDQTPHTGIAEVDCTTDCHVEDREKIDSMEPSLTSFHEGDAIGEIEHNSSCTVCHSIYPHGNDLKVRAIFNLHSAHLFCEVCHLKPERYLNQTYDWSPPERVQFLGKPFANYVAEESTSTEAKYALSRIAVYTDLLNVRKMVLDKKDFELAVTFSAATETMPAAEKQEQLDYFHREIVRKEIRVACNECHQENGRLNFRELGFDEDRTRILEHLNIKGWATEYDTFYFPKLF